ncbi:MAG: 6-carboxytetrahydropterin synthase QueD [Candidatus Neomarinimicrobiota bacterium]
MELTKTFTFDMAHRLSFHKGKCKNLHGHTYKLEVSLSGVLDENGMLMDFGDLKKICMDKVVNVLDHSTMIYEKDELLMNSFPKELYHIVVPFEPTAENISKWIAKELEEGGLNIKQVAVWETASSKALYTK